MARQLQLLVEFLGVIVITTTVLTRDRNGTVLVWTPGGTVIPQITFRSDSACEKALVKFKVEFAARYGQDAVKYASGSCLSTY